MEDEKLIENLEWEFEDLNEKCSECYPSACNSYACESCLVDKRLDEIYNELKKIK